MVAINAKETLLTLKEKISGTEVISSTIERNINLFMFRAEFLVSHSSFTRQIISLTSGSVCVCVCVCVC